MGLDNPKDLYKKTTVGSPSHNPKRRYLKSRLVLACHRPVWWRSLTFMGAWSSLAPRCWEWRREILLWPMSWVLRCRVEKVLGKGKRELFQGFPIGLQFFKSFSNRFPVFYFFSQYIVFYYSSPVVFECFISFQWLLVVLRFFFRVAFVGACRVVSSSGILMSQMFRSSWWWFLRGGPWRFECWVWMFSSPVLSSHVFGQVTHVVNTHCHADHITSGGKIQQSHPEAGLVSWLDENWEEALYTEQIRKGLEVRRIALFPPTSVSLGSLASVWVSHCMGKVPEMGFWWCRGVWPMCQSKTSSVEHARLAAAILQAPSVSKCMRVRAMWAKTRKLVLLSVLICGLTPRISTFSAQRQLPLPLVREKTGLNAPASVGEKFRSPVNKTGEFIQPTRKEKNLIRNLKEARKTKDDRMWENIWKACKDTGCHPIVLGAAMHTALRLEDYQEGSVIYRRIQNLNLPMTLPMYTTAMKLCGKLAHFEEVDELWGKLVRLGEIDSHAAAARIDAAADEGHIEGAKQVLDYMREENLSADVAHFTSAINACANANGAGHAKSAQRFFDRMLAQGIKPDVAVFTSLVGAFRGEPSQSFFRLLKDMKKYKLKADKVFVERFLGGSLNIPKHKDRRISGDEIEKHLWNQTHADLVAATKRIAAWRKGNFRIMTGFSQAICRAIQNVLRRKASSRRPTAVWDGKHLPSEFPWNSMRSLEMGFLRCATWKNGGWLNLRGSWVVKASKEHLLFTGVLFLVWKIRGSLVCEVVHLLASGRGALQKMCVLPREQVWTTWDAHVQEVLGS